MNTPNITTAQVTALIQWILSVVVAFGVHLTEAQSIALVGGASFAAGALHLGDAIIRHGRSRALAPVPTTSNEVARKASETLS